MQRLWSSQRYMCSVCDQAEDTCAVSVIKPKIPVQRLWSSQRYLCSVCDQAEGTLCSVCDQAEDTLCSVCDQAEDTLCNVCDQAEDTSCNVYDQAEDILFYVCDHIKDTLQHLWRNQMHFAHASSSLCRGAYIVHEHTPDKTSTLPWIIQPWKYWYLVHVKLRQVALVKVLSCYWLWIYLCQLGKIEYRFYQRLFFMVGQEENNLWFCQYYICGQEFCTQSDVRNGDFKNCNVHKYNHDLLVLSVSWRVVSEPSLEPKIIHDPEKVEGLRPYYTVGGIFACRYAEAYL